MTARAWVVSIGLVGASLVAMSGNEGWGWILFIVALLVL